MRLVSFLFGSKAVSRTLLLAIGATSLSAQTTSKQYREKAPETAYLRLNQPVTRDLRAGEFHSYIIPILKGDFLDVIVDQQGVDVRLSLSRPDGKQVSMTNASPTGSGRERIYAIASKSGNYQLKVESDPDSHAGAYVIELKTLRAAKPSDSEYLKAEDTFMKGVVLSSREKDENRSKALAAFNTSLEMWVRLDDSDAQATTLQCIARVYRRSGQFDLALDSYNRARLLEHKSNHDRHEAEVLHAIGLTFQQSRQPQKALEALKQSLAIWRQLGDRQEEASVLYALGDTHFDLSDFETSLDSYRQASSLWKEEGDQRAHAIASGDMARTYNRLGQSEKALTELEHALALWRMLGDRFYEAFALDSIGDTYSLLGKMAEAINYRSQALAVVRAVGKKQQIADVLDSIGRDYASLGDHQKALDYFKQELVLRNKRSAQAPVLRNIGRAYAELKDKPKAFELLNRALAISKATGDRTAEADALAEIARTYSKFGDYQAAVHEYNKALTIRHTLHDRRSEALTLDELAGEYSQLREYQKALDAYNQELLLWQSEPDEKWQALTLSGIAKVYANEHDNAQSIEYYNRSLEVWRRLGNRDWEASTLMSIGLTYSGQKEYEKALEPLRQALSIRIALGDNKGAANSASFVASTYADLGDSHKELEYQNQELSFWQAEFERTKQGDVLYRMALTCSALGDHQKALGYLRQAVGLHRAAANLGGEALDLYEMARAHQQIGEKQPALNSYKEALVLWEQQKDLGWQRITLSRIAEVYDSLAQLDKALEAYNQSLKMARAEGDPKNESMVLKDIGEVYLELKQKEKALEFFDQAGAVARNTQDPSIEGNILKDAGSALFAHGDWKNAQEYLSRAQPLLHRVGSPDEAIVLFGLGVTHALAGEIDKALASYDEALLRAREGQDHVIEVLVLDVKAVLQITLGRNEEALNTLKEAFPLSRIARSPVGAAYTTLAMAVVYQNLDEDQKAFEITKISLPLWESAGNRPMQARLLGIQSMTYAVTGESQKALETLDKLLLIVGNSINRPAGSGTFNRMPALREGASATTFGQEPGAFSLIESVFNRDMEAATLGNIGYCYHGLGDNSKALEFYQQALPLAQGVPDRALEALLLKNIGEAYNELHEYEKALDYLQQALTKARLIKNVWAEGLTLDSLAAIEINLGKHAQAREYLTQALPLVRTLGKRRYEARVLRHTAVADWELGDRNQALSKLTQALSLSRAVDDVSQEALILATLMHCWKEQDNRPLAIFFGKQSVNAYQRLRRNIQGLDKHLQKSFIHSKEDTYRDLVELLIQEGKLPEAQQVLGSLKDQEYFDFVRRDTRSATDVVGPVADSHKEKEFQQRYREVSDQLAAAGEKWFDLSSKVSRTSQEETQLAELSGKMRLANQAMDAFYDSFYVELGKSPAAAKSIGQTKEGASELQTTLQDLPPGTVVLYTLVGEDAYHVILVTRSLMLQREYKISAKQLRRKVVDFLEVLRDPQADPAPKAQDLYEIMVAPVAKDLDAMRARTLMWSLDDVLRYVPVAALSDGKSYLLEKYRNEIFTPASIPNLAKTPQIKIWRGVGLGTSSAFEGFQPLPSVPIELRKVIRDTRAGSAHGVVPGQILLDSEFTKAGLEQALSKKYPLVHIASHFSFRPGDEMDSFLLLGGANEQAQARRLTLAEIRDNPMITFRNVELLTLSACDTASGGTSADGKEVEGFGRMAQQKGAQAVIATLWEVNDESTSLLMERFYRNWMSSHGIAKAEALRRAQLSLLRGNESAKLGPSAKSPYGHPYFWAPFILIGNWQ